MGRGKKGPLLESINTLQKKGERGMPAAGRSRCAFEWQIRARASLMHRQRGNISQELEERMEHFVFVSVIRGTLPSHCVYFPCYVRTPYSSLLSRFFFLLHASAEFFFFFFSLLVLSCYLDLVLHTQKHPVFELHLFTFRFQFTPNPNLLRFISVLGSCVGPGDGKIGFLVVCYCESSIKILFKCHIEVKIVLP